MLRTRKVLSSAESCHKLSNVFSRCAMPLNFELYLIKRQLVAKILSRKRKVLMVLRVMLKTQIVSTTEQHKPLLGRVGCSCENLTG